MSIILLKHLSGKTLYRYVSYLLFLVIFQITILCLTAHTGYTAQATAIWDPNSEATLTNYKIYYGTQSRSYIFSRDVGNQTSYIITGLAAGTKYFFAVTAYDTYGYESNYSEEVTYTTPAAVTTTSSVLPTTTTTSVRPTTTSTAVSTVTTVQPTTSTVLPATTTAPEATTTTIPKTVTTTIPIITTTTAAITTSTTTTVPDNPADNQQPVANAGEDRTAYVGEVINLDGSGSYDNENDVLYYSWSQISGPIVELANSSSSAPSFTADTAGSYTFELIVSDGILQSVPDTVIINILGSGDIQILGPENGLTIPDAPVFEWEAEDFNLYKIQISKDGTRFFTIGFTRKKSFKLKIFWIKLITTEAVTPVYWRVLGKRSKDKSWGASEAQMFYLVK